jgi:anti-sigma factor (TIGR02949 family)
MSIEPTLIAAMDCCEIERSIDPYVDGEFDARERADLDAHLAACPACRTRVEAQARLRAALKTKLREAMGSPAVSHAPAELRERISGALARERRPLLRRALAPVPMAAMAACAAGVLVVAMLHYFDGDGARQPSAVDEVVRRYHLKLPLEVQAVDEASMLSWFDGKLEFRPVPPRFKAAGVHLMGGRLSHVRELSAAYVHYQLPVGQAGIFIVDDPQGRFEAPGREIKIGPHIVHVVRARGYNAVVWRQDEIVYSLVSDLDENALFQLVQSAQAGPAR